MLARAVTISARFGSSLGAGVKRLAYVVLAGLAMSISPPAFAKPRAIEIAINGIGPPADLGAVQTVRQVIGHAVGDGTIDRFIVSGYGIEGGFRLRAGGAVRRI